MSYLDGRLIVEQEYNWQIEFSKKKKKKKWQIEANLYP